MLFRSDATRKLWRTKRGAGQSTKAGKPYLFNHKALAKVFRAKMLTGISAAGLTLPACYPQQWVVDCKSVGSGATALIYLGRYLYRGVIRENDIIACTKGQVTFRYRDAKTGIRSVLAGTVPGSMPTPSANVFSMRAAMPASGEGLVQQRVQIVASHDLTLVVSH